MIRTTKFQPVETLEMHGISEAEFQLRVQPIMKSVFQGKHEWDVLFSPEIDSKRIIFPLEIYTDLDLLRLLLEAIVEAATFVGDNGCYLSEVNQYPREYNHAYIHLSELIEGYVAPRMSRKLFFMQLDMEFSNYFMLYSEYGKWGLFSSLEYFSLLGGSNEFMKIIEHRIPDIESQTYEFLKHFRGEPRDERDLSQGRQLIGGMLNHIYGSSKAERLLRETGWYTLNP